MFIIMKTQELVDVRVGERTKPDYGYELSDRCIITKVQMLSLAEQEAKACFRIKVLN